MATKTKAVAILLLLFLSLLVPTSISEESNIPWWDKEWDSRFEIIVPIDTSLENAKYQPIDVSLTFEEKCWAKNENEHSIRVIMQKPDKNVELECQIYDLKIIEKEFISSCNLVFLIPEEATGDEKYFVYYDDQEKSAPNYEKRVDVSESSYYYQPIAGINFYSEFYKITQGEEIVFVISKEGEVLGYKGSQKLGFINNGEKEITPKSLANLIDLSCIYYWKINNKWLAGISSHEKIISKQVVVNGNLMATISIKSQSEDGSLQSTVFYKYYFCPTDNKRIYLHVKHEILKHPLPSGDEIDFSYMTFPMIKVKSSTIDELNIGEIPKYLHYYSQDESIASYQLNQNPETHGWKPEIEKTDDYDLGSKSWLSYDYGQTGKANAIIFESNKVIKSGTDERDGIELQMQSAKNIDILGLQAQTIVLYLARNAFEKDAIKDETLPKDLVIEFNAEFFSSKNGGYLDVDKESDMYSKLISFQPEINTDLNDGDTSEVKYNLTVNVFQAYSFPFPFCYILSDISGINFPFISAELIKENSDYKRLDVVNRLPLKITNTDFNNKTLFEMFKIFLDYLDWKNASIFKKVEFKDITPGRYLVKIYRENKFFSDQKSFIGYKIIDVKGDTKTNVYCKPEGKIKITLNEDKGGTENTDIYLISDNFPIVSVKTDSKGEAFIGAPCGSSFDYKIRTVYKGFLIEEEDIKLGIIRTIIPLEKNYDFDVYDFKVNIKDSDGNSVNDIEMSLTSSEMDYPVDIDPIIDSDGSYLFNDLIAANYVLTINYDQFKINEQINIPENDILAVDLSDLTININDKLNLSPEVILDFSLKSINFEKNAVLIPNSYNFSTYIFKNLYPGKYLLTASYQQFEIKEEITIPSKTIELVLPAIFNVTTNIYDARGNPLSNVIVKMTRNAIEINRTSDENGQAIFSLPPGTYINEIYCDNVLIAKRIIHIISNNEFDILTEKEPIYPWIVVALAIIIGMICAFFSYRKRNVLFFLKLLVVILLIAAIALPWWSINGESDNPRIERDTNFYLTPIKMVTLISTDNATGGEITKIDDTLKKEYDIFGMKVEIKFIEVMEFLPVLMVIGSIFIVISLVLTSLLRKRLSLLFIILALIVYFDILFAFSFGMSEFANEIIGGFVGSGELGISIPGETDLMMVNCNWGPSIGYYIFLASIILLDIILIWYVVSYIINRRKNNNGLFFKNKN